LPRCISSSWWISLAEVRAGWVRETQPAIKPEPLDFKALKADARRIIEHHIAKGKPAKPYKPVRIVSLEC
jgi:hypothetical protein